MGKKIIDFYEMFNLLRSTTCEEICAELKQQMRRTKQIGERITDKLNWRSEVLYIDDIQQQLLENQSRIKLIEEAQSVLIDEATRSQYDRKLDSAYDSGRLVRVKSEAGYTFTAIAEKAFDDQEYDKAAQYAQEALALSPNDEQLYKILAHSFFVLKMYDEAYAVAERGSSAFEMSADIQWLSIRLNIITSNYVIAVARMFKCQERFPNDTRFQSEKIFLEIYEDHIDQAQSDINQYFKDYPDSIEYRMQVAYILMEAILQKCVYDSKTGSLVITEKSDYDICDRLIRMAQTLYNDEILTETANRVGWYGSLVYDERFDDLRKFYIVSAVVVLVAGYILHYPVPAAIISILLFILGVFVKKFGYRPGWMAAKESFTGISQRQDGVLYTILQLPQIIVDQIIAGFTNG